MTYEERIDNLVGLGYTGKEAEFLCRAALHSGYFVRRQFLMFADRDRGKTDAALAEKALSAGHVKELVFRHNRSVYSICSKSLFAALGDVDNRNRRTHEVLTIKSRLIGLDYVLANVNLRYLATEAEKVEFFRDHLGIGLEYLPAKRYRAKESENSTDRYFVDKFPIAVEDRDGGPSIVFCYVDEGAHSTSGFESYLVQYRPLFMRVRQFRLVYVSVFRRHFDDAKRLFESRILGQVGRPSVDLGVARLLQYFSDRQAYELKDLARFDQRKLIQFREDRSQFSGSEYEALFELWQKSGDAEVLRRLCPAMISERSGARSFSTWLSAFRYELFGTLVSGARAESVGVDGVRQ